MHLRFLSYVSCVLFASAATMQAAPGAAPFGQFEAPHTTKFTLTSATQIPALELKPGTYSISIVDHLPDRTVLRIEGAKDDVRTMVLAVQNPKLLDAHAAGPILWSKGPALRGFSFGGRGAMELVYPKGEAVDIAKKNGQHVLAYDPDAEIPIPNKALGPDDYKLVSLWLLTPTKVGPDAKEGPGIEAVKYAPPVPDAPTQQASGNGASQQVAKLHKPAIGRLPRTASLLPLIFALGVLSLLGASLLGIARGVKHGA